MAMLQPDDDDDNDDDRHDDKCWIVVGQAF